MNLSTISNLAYLAEPLVRAGLGELSLGPVHVGARFSLGFEFDKGLTLEIEPVMQAIQARLRASGYVSTDTRISWLAGYVNPFVVIEGKSGREYGSASHLKDAVLSVVENVWPIDAGTVRFEAETYQPGQPANAAPIPQRYDAPAGGGNTAPPPPPAPSEFGQFFDQLALDLGISRGSAFGLAVAGVVLGLVVLRRAL